MAQASQMEQAPEVTPVVAVSQCLGFAAVRYNGQLLQDAFVQALGRYVRFVQVCPEVGIGLGVPRDPIRIVSGDGEQRLVQPATGRDLTAAMESFSQGFLTGLGEVDGFILKSRSPSCGIKDVKVFAAKDGSPLEKTSGFFARAVLARFPLAAIEDEGRLTNFRLRHHFLTRLFAYSRFREVQRCNHLRELVRFHTEYKLQWMAYSQRGLKALGGVVARPGSRPVAEVMAEYREGLGRLLAEPARSSSNRNVLQHAFGYLSDQLGASEKAHFLELLEEYRHGRLPLSALLTLLRSWVLRFGEPYLAMQRYFEPYPRTLIELSDSAQGKEPA